MDRKKWILTIAICMLFLATSFSGAGSKIISVNKIQNMKQVMETAELSTNSVNILFLHGMPGDHFSMEPLKNEINSLYAARGITLNYKNPDLDNTASLDTWAQNIATVINNWGVSNIIIVGHSMGGKTAIHAVYQDYKGCRSKVNGIVTINSPIKKFQDEIYNRISGYKYPDWLLQNVVTALKILTGYDINIINGLTDVVNFDSTTEANWVTQNKHWLAFISGESYPTDTRFDIPTIGDLYPRNMDDLLIPMSRQYTDQADTVYYGVYNHSAVFDDSSARNIIANNIVKYFCGETIKCSVSEASGQINHQSRLASKTWNDIVGNGIGNNNILAQSGTFSQKGTTFPWKKYTTTVGSYLGSGLTRTGWDVHKINTALLASVYEVKWTTADPHDGRLTITVRVSWKVTIQVYWGVYVQGPPAKVRDHYEVEVLKHSVPTAILVQLKNAYWESSNVLDHRVHIISWTFILTWIRIGWTTYIQEDRTI